MKLYLINNFKPLSIVFVLTVLFLIKIIPFVNSYGALEHDSGWNLGLAKNLATKGIYASYANTIATESAGAYGNIHHRYSVQDQQGFVYFPAAAAIGPGYIVPQALMIRLFGNGWWQYRAWPLISFTLLLLLLFLIVWRLGNIFGLIFFALWLWIIPQFTTQMAYEALSEHIALLYLLIGYGLLYLNTKTHHLGITLLSGLFIAFSYLTKSIYILPAMGVLVYLQCDYFIYESNKKYLFSKWFIFIIAVLVPIVAFNTYRDSTLTTLFGEVGLQAFRQESRLVFSQSGSGTDPMAIVSQSSDFIFKKLSIWTDMGIGFPGIIWIILLLTPFVFLKYLPTEGKIFCSSIYFASFVSFIWFIFFSTDGWGRHIWQGLILSMMLISINLGLVYRHFPKTKLKVFWLIFLPVCLGILNYSVINISPILDQSTINTWRSLRKIRGLDGFPSNPVLSLTDQQQIVTYISSSLTKSDRVYYVLGYLNAEISTLVDKVFYSFERYLQNGQINPNGGKSYLIIGPYQQGIWSDTPINYVTVVTEKACSEIVFRNPSYILCTLKSNLLLKE